MRQLGLPGIREDNPPCILCTSATTATTVDSVNLAYKWHKCKNINGIYMYKEIQLQLHLFILWKVPALGTMWCWTHKWGQWNWPTRGNIKYILIPSYVQNSEDSHADEEEKLDVITSTQIAFIFEQC